MAANQKLTHTIAKRQIDSVRQVNGTLYLDFADGSTRAAGQSEVAPVAGQGL